MKLIIQATECLSAYYADRDLSALQRLITLLQAEYRDPSIQEALITLPDIDNSELGYVFEHEGCLRINTNEADANQPVEENKAVRVRTNDGEQYLCFVAAMINDLLILTPLIGPAGL